MNFSPEKLFLVGIIALVVLGPNRLPQAARTAGRLLAEFRRMSTNLQSEVTEALAEPRDAMQRSIGEFGLTNVRSQLRNTINEVVAPPKPTNGVDAASSDGHGPSAWGAVADGAVGAEANALGAVGAPIVDPSRTVEMPAPPAPLPTSASQPAALPVAPDDPSLN